MKQRQYLHVTYLASFGWMNQDFKLNEVHLITKCLKEQAIEDKCEVTLVTCTSERYKSIFG